MRGEQKVRVAVDDDVATVFHRARGGDDDALNTLVRHMRPRLFRVARAVLGDDGADDVAQDALLRALDTRVVFVGAGRVEGWMLKIAFNLARNRRRDRRRQREITDGATASESARTHGAGAPSPDAATTSNRVRDAVVLAIDALSRRQADVVTLRVFGEYNFGEIGAVLGISEENARVTSNIALKRVRESLQNAGVTLEGIGS